MNIFIRNNGRTVNNIKSINTKSLVLDNLPPSSCRVSQYKRIQREALSLFSKKNADYGDAFAQFGAVGVIVRMNDKINRMISLEKNKVQFVDDENIRDTLIDLHNYSAMALMLLDEKKPNN